MVNWQRLALFLAIGTLIAGCGGGNELETSPAKGRVLLDGQPLTKGTVSFRPKAGSPATGTIQPDGTFVMTTFEDGDGAIVGTHDVMIFAPQGEVSTAAGEDGGPIKSAIPSKYSSFSTSELTAEVVAGTENDFTFELEK